MEKIKCQICGGELPKDFHNFLCPKCEDKWDEAKEVAAELKRKYPEE